MMSADVMDHIILVGMVPILYIIALTAIFIAMIRSNILSWTRGGRLFRSFAIVVMTLGSVFAIYIWITDWRYFFMGHPLGPLAAMDYRAFMILETTYTYWQEASLPAQVIMAFLLGFASVAIIASIFTMIVSLFRPRNRIIPG